MAYHPSPFVFGTALVLLRLMRDALHDEKMAIKESAQWQEINEGQYVRQLDGKEHLSLLRMHKLPMRVIRRFFWNGFLEFGPPPDVKQEIRGYITWVRHQRMVRARHTAQKAERSA